MMMAAGQTSLLLPVLVTNHTVPAAPAEMWIMTAIQIYT